MQYFNDLINISIHNFYRIVIACCVLHNIALERQQPLDEDPDAYQESEFSDEEEETSMGILKRDQLVANYEKIEVSFKWHLFSSYNVYSNSYYIYYREVWSQKLLLTFLRMLKFSSKDRPRGCPTRCL